jgi:hypothetical protein
LCFGNVVFVIQKSASSVAGKSVADVDPGYVKIALIWQHTQKDAHPVENTTHKD